VAARKRRIRAVVLLCVTDGPGKLAALALWADLNNLDHIYPSDLELNDSTGTSRNTVILNDANAFVAFRSVEGWPQVVEDLIVRAQGSGRQVRVIET
jgi:hypothetical protein